jgi:molybdopterin-containing oxidoreductase family iron-sulfur binding subunit
VSVKPHFNYDKAKVILSLDCDFIGAEEDAHNSIRKFIQGRRVENPSDSMNRLYVIEGLMTLTGVNADHRLRVGTSLIAQMAPEILAAVNGRSPTPIAGVDSKWITECARDLAANRGASLVVAGYRQPLIVHLVAYAINAALGNLGQTVVFHEAADLKEAGLADLAKSLVAGEVETLVMLGANPAYNAPADLNWTTAQSKAKRVVRLGYFEDETYEATKRADDWHLPMAHYLESWGDALTSDGTLVPIQPLIAPLFGGWTEIEVLARIAGESTFSPHEIARETFATISGKRDDESWQKFLYNGFLEDSAAKPVNVRFDEIQTVTEITNLLNDNKSVPRTPLGKDSLEVIFQRDYSVDDGRYSNNGWLQELPDPVGKFVWDNVVLLSRKTARELGVRNMDVVKVKLGDRTVEGPIWVQPGMADFVLGLALGYGREWGGRIAYKVGFNAYALRTSAAENIATGATITPTGGRYKIACTQDHWSMEGRPIIRESNLEQYREHVDFVKNMNGHSPPGGDRPMYPNPFDIAKAAGHHQWGMSIDLTACVGCSACMMACQSENNVPIVGKDLVGRGREMHWIRIDRYYTGDPKKRRWDGIAFDNETFEREDKQQFAEWIDDPQVVTQPMLCQHCEAAPCENVCPVNATVHDNEGLNLMVYNRCVGTRYCSNNCPYKVRRFNYLDFNKRSLKELKGPFYPVFANGSLSKWLADPQDPRAGMRPEEEWDLISMMKNPDVTVRMRGVMEKCTFCVQRIEQAKIARKVKAGASGDVLVPDGAESKELTALKTACQQACPAGAIVFGNIADPQSKVSKLKAQERNYSVLNFLLTKPRTTYLARLRNPNKAMPDYQEHPSPFSLQEFEHQGGGNPFEHHHDEEGAEH